MPLRSVSRLRAPALRRMGAAVAGAASIALLSTWTASAAEEAEVNFAADVWPILEEKCISCHGADESFNGLRLDNAEAILKGGRGGKAVVPGDPDKSPLYTRTNLPADDFDIMPVEGDPLTPEQVETLRVWIAAGAPFGEWASAEGP